jgi:hypothetical protein
MRCRPAVYPIVDHRKTRNDIFKADGVLVMRKQDILHELRNSELHSERACTVKFQVTLRLPLEGLNHLAL